jgi:hypothetical protein
VVAAVGDELDSPIALRQQGYEQRSRMRTRLTLRTWRRRQSSFDREIARLTELHRRDADP